MHFLRKYLQPRLHLVLFLGVVLFINIGLQICESPDLAHFYRYSPGRR